MYQVFDSVIDLAEQRTNLEYLNPEGIISTNINKWSIKPLAHSKYRVH